MLTVALILMQSRCEPSYVGSEIVMDQDKVSMFGWKVNTFRDFELSLVALVYIYMYMYIYIYTKCMTLKTMINKVLQLQK